MAGMPWVKVYTETLDEVKLVDLTDEQKWRFIQLILVAAECDAEGALVTRDSPVSHKQLCWRLRCESQTLINDIKALIEAGLIHKEDGAIVVTKFAERQGPTQEEKRKQWRDRQNKRRTGARNGDVTQESPVTHARVTLLEEEEEEDIEKEKEKELINAATAAPPQPLTEGQRFVMDAFGAKRFRTNFQRDAVSEAETIYGIEKLREYTKWAATKGFTLGDAVSKMDLTLKKWGKPKPIPHQSTDAIDDAWREAQGNG